MASYIDQEKLDQELHDLINDWLDRSPVNSLQDLAMISKVPEDDLFMFYHHDEAIAHDYLVRLVDCIATPNQRDFFDRTFLSKAG